MDYETGYVVAVCSTRERAEESLEETLTDPNLYICGKPDPEEYSIQEWEID
jgi:hypothetical protein